MIVYSYIEWRGSDSNAAQIKREIYKTAVLVNLDYAYGGGGMGLDRLQHKFPSSLTKRISKCL